MATCKHNSFRWVNGMDKVACKTCYKTFHMDFINRRLAHLRGKINRLQRAVKPNEREWV